MTDLIFVTRAAGNPNPWFRTGAVTITDGFVTDENGVTTSYAVVRALAFSDPATPKVTGWIEPGDLGIRPLQFRLGRVVVKGPERQSLLFTEPSGSHQFLDGRVRVVSMSVSTGSLRDFAVWTTQQDPADFYVETATALNSGGVGSPWSKHHAIFVPHRDAAYLAVGTRVDNMPNSGGDARNQYVKKWMLESRPVTETVPSSAYRKAREVQVTVRPDRVNYCANPSFDVSTAGWGSVGVLSMTSLQAKYGTNSLRSTTASGTYGNATYSADVWRPGWWTVSGWIYSEVPRKVWFETEVEYPTFETEVFTGDQVDIPANKWVRVHQTFYVPQETSSAFVTFGGFAASEPGSTSVYVDGVLMENTDTLRDYFDGSTSGDTIWESGGTPGLSRSYFYKNRTERYAALLRVLEDNVPMGIGIANPILGTLPPVESEDV